MAFHGAENQRDYGQQYHLQYPVYELLSKYDEDVADGKTDNHIEEPFPIQFLPLVRSNEHQEQFEEPSSPETTSSTVDHPLEHSDACDQASCKVFFCHWCSSCFTDFGQWEFHERTIHAEKELYKDGDWQDLLWTCPLCDRRDMNWSGRVRHLFYHDSMLPSEVKACRCTLGVSPRLPAFLASLGQGHIYYNHCKPVWLCFEQGKPLESQEPLYGRINSRRCSRGGLVYPPLRVPTYFWCGICRDVVQDQDLRYSAGSYDCTRFYHFDREHCSNEEEWKTWQPMTQSAAGMLFSNLLQAIRSAVITSSENLPGRMSVEKYSIYWSLAALIYHAYLQKTKYSPLGLSRLIKWLLNEC